MTGIGFQFGASYGIYDWNGRASALNNATQAQTQVFITTGFFKKVNDTSNWSYGLVHDWMVNRNFGVEANNPTLGQWRGQISYATNAWNEIGAWATLRDKGMSRSTDLGNAQVAYRAIDQIDFFWHHKYEFCGDSWMWFGLPQNNRLAGGGSLGDFIIGGTYTTPLNDYMSLYANMHIHAPHGRTRPDRVGRRRVVRRHGPGLLRRWPCPHQHRGRQLLAAVDADGQQRKLPGRRQLDALDDSGRVGRVTIEARGFPAGLQVTLQARFIGRTAARAHSHSIVAGGLVLMS